MIGSQVSVQLTSPEGDVWEMSDHDPYHFSGPRVVLLADEVSGLVGRVDRSKVQTVNRLGVRSRGWSTPALDMSLGVLLQAERGDLPRFARLFRDGWLGEEAGDYAYELVPPERPTISVQEGGGERFWTPVSDVHVPDVPHGLGSSTSLHQTITMSGDLGHWFGDGILFGEGEHEITPAGDRPLWPLLKLHWDGSATSVTFPTGVTVHFPPIGVPRTINLDRGMSGQVTRPDGSVDTASWSALQGTVTGVVLRPGSPSLWEIGAGMTLEVTPRFLSPWGVD